MKKALTLSLVIPVYNEEDHIKQCLDAVKSQSRMPDEVIVVDNNSTDSTLRIAKRYSFVKIVSERKQGVFHARNKGFDSVKSDIIGRIDADTLLRQDWTKKVIDNFSRTPVAAITGPVSYYDMPLSSVNHYIDHAFKNVLYKYGKNFPFLFGTNMAIRKSAWEDIRGEVCDDRGMHEDLDLAIHLDKKKYGIMYDRHLLAGMSTRRFDDSLRDFKQYNQMMSQTYDKHGMDTIAPDIAKAAFMAGYFVFWPLRRTYDEQSKKRSVRNLLFGKKQPRKNPND